MNISYPAHDGVVIATKNRAISLGQEVRIGDYLIPGAGEFDIAGIQCEVHFATQGLVYFIRLEELQITFLSEINSQVISLADAASTNILVINLRSSDQPETLTPILKGLEPSFVFLFGPGATKEFIQSLSLPNHDSNVLKITRSGLPLEGTYLVSRE